MVIHAFENAVLSLFFVGETVQRRDEEGSGMPAAPRDAATDGAHGTAQGAVLAGSTARIVSPWAGTSPEARNT